MSKLGKTMLLVAGVSAMTFAPAFTRSAPALVQGMKPLLIRDVDAPAVRPFQTTLRVCTGACAFPSTFTVPTRTNGGEAVQRLVLEYVSGFCSIPSSSGTPTVLWLELQTTAGEVAAQHKFIPELPITSDLLVLAAESVRIYADPGSVMTFDAPFNGSGFCELVPSGHFVVE